MAHIEDRWIAKDGTQKARHGQGLRWMVKYDGPDGRRRKRSFARKVQAEAYMAEVSVQVTQGDWTDPALGRITVRDLAEEWLPTQSTKRRSYAKGQKSALDSHILPSFGDRRIATITTPEVEAWVADLLTGRGPSGKPLAADSVRKMHGVFKRLMDYAVRGERIRRNRVAEATNVPRKAQGLHHTYLTHSQVWALADAVRRPSEGLTLVQPGTEPTQDVPAAEKATRESLRALILVAAYTGLRFGELIGLDVVKYDRRRRRLLVDVQYAGEGLKDHARRTVPLPATVADTLEEFIGNRVSGPLFPAPRGGRWHYKRFRVWFDSAAVSVGMAGLKPHDLRHTAASLAVQSGATVKAVQAMLGHESATLTLDTYSDLFDGDLDDVAARMDAALRPPSGPDTQNAQAG